MLCLCHNSGSLAFWAVLSVHPEHCTENNAGASHLLEHPAHTDDYMRRARAPRSGARGVLSGPNTGLGHPPRNFFKQTTLDSSQLIIHRLTNPRTASTQKIRDQKHELAEHAAGFATAVLRRHNGIRRSHSIMPRELLRSSTRT